jgi:hypothetical protein
MTSLAQQQNDSSVSQTLEEINTRSTASSLQLVTDSISAETMPRTQILSYLNPHASDSRNNDFNLYNELIEQTADTDSSIKGPLSAKVEPKNIIFPEKFKAKPRQDFFNSLQAWEGIVIEVMVDSFLARLIDLTNTGVDEEAEFSMNDISDDDKPLVKPGAIFYWDIGYHTSYSGQRTRSSLIRFRRLPAWTQQEIEAAEREADRIGKALGWQ